MKERPILFSAPMVRALMAGTKTQTRRVVKFDLYKSEYEEDWYSYWWKGKEFSGARHSGIASLCPYGQPGDRLWVRETWKTMLHYPGYDNGITEGGSEDFAEGVATIAYQAGGDFKTFDFLTEEEDDQARRGTLTWKPSIHMPRWASRITLEVTAVRVERLQDISEGDAKAEGVQFAPGFGNAYYHVGQAHISEQAAMTYRYLWESINGPESWKSNPWVWVVEFRMVTP